MIARQRENQPANPNTQKFIRGYEIERCPLKLWEDAILQGYEVFRQMKKNNGGIVIGDRENRRISYRPLGE